MCWMGLHSCEEASSTRGQADGGSLWTSSNQHRREILHRCHESDEQHSGDAGSYRSTILAEHVRGTGCTPCYQRRTDHCRLAPRQGADRRKSCGCRKQSARHIASPHVESDEGKITTPHSLDTRTHRRRGEQHRRSLGSISGVDGHR